jgi:hypothetical protein
MKGSTKLYLRESKLEGATHALEYASIMVLFVTAVVLSLIRLDPTDTPWHLATARFAFQSGRWPVINTFSYTYPNYPLFQQYPLYQSLLYLIYLIGGWEGLSVFNCIMWVTVFALFILWAKSGFRWSQACSLSLLWLLALLGLQRRMILRPDILTFFLLILLLYLIYLYSRGRIWTAGLFVVMQFLLVNSHQLFLLGLLIQGSFLVHLLIVRLWGGKAGISSADKNVPLLPVVLALFGSIIVCFMSPLGTDIVRVPFKTAASLYNYKKEVPEFAPFYTSHYDLLLIVLLTVIVWASFYARRRDWRPFEILLWAISAAMVLSATRGSAFYALICAGLSAGNFLRDGNSYKSGTQVISPERASQLFRSYCALITIGICLLIVYGRWFSPAKTLTNVQSGIGLASGRYPLQAVEFLKTNPPPGKMMNLSWYSGNALIWGLYPQYQVFVDPRFETYPRNFLIQAIEAPSNNIVLQQLLGEYGCNWVVGEVRDPNVRKSVAGLLKDHSWRLVYADTIFLILIKNVPENKDYLMRHLLEPADILPVDFVRSEPDILALQQLNMARLYIELDLLAKARQMVDAARSAASHYSVVADELKMVIAILAKDATK